jgi:hypothetical protein
LPWLSRNGARKSKNEPICSIGPNVGLNRKPHRRAPRTTVIANGMKI